MKLTTRDGPKGEAHHQQLKKPTQHAFGADDEAWDSWVASRRQLDIAVAVEKQRQHAQDALGQVPQDVLE